MISGKHVAGRWRAMSALLVIGGVLACRASAQESVTRIPAHEPRLGRTHPVIAVVGENAGTELTDFVVPYGILSQSRVANVLTVAAGAGPIHFRPALQIQPDLTMASFDERFPAGADYVIVPAVMAMRGETPSPLVEWIRSQAGKGASIVSICDGALVVAAAGVFKGRRATGHWATLKRRKHDFPDTQWLENTRYVADGVAISSAGVSASIPISLALVEAIAGADRARDVALDLGVADWSSSHDSGRFHLGVGTYSLAIRNWLLPRQEIGLPVADGVDEIALALTADAFSRTYRSRAVSVADTAATIRTRHGLVLLPDRVKGEGRIPRRSRPVPGGPSTGALDLALEDITRTYGSATARFVALQLEYPGL